MRGSTTLSDSQVRDIVTVVRAAKGWRVEDKGDGRFVCFPPKRSQTPVVLKRTESKAFVAYREFRARGLHVDPNKVGRPAVNDKRTNPLDEFDESTLPPMPFGEVRVQKPLPPGDPSNYAKSFGWSKHVIERLEERGIGVFELFAALDQPDYTTDWSPGGNGKHNVRLFVRGDIRLAVDIAARNVITAIDLNEDTRTERRQPLIPATNLPSLTSETEMANDDTAGKPDALFQEPKPPGQQSPPPTQDRGALTASMRKVFGKVRKGGSITADEVMAACPLATAANVHTFVHMQRTKGFIAEGRGNDGGYIVLDPVAIAHRGIVRKGVNPPPAKAVNAPDSGRHRGGVVSRENLDRARMVNSGEMEPAHKLIRKLIADWVPGRTFTVAEITPHITGLARTTLLGALAKLADEGVLIAEPWLGGVNARVWRIPGGEPAVATVPPDEDDIQYHVAFAFEAPPPSDIFDLAIVLRQQKAIMCEHPLEWARLAVYDTANDGVISKRAAKLEEYMNDPNLQFQVRRVNESQIGLFARALTRQAR